MEKQRIKSITKSGRRLLVFSIFLLLCSNSLFSHILTYAEVSALSILPAEGEKLYAKKDIKFEVLLPDTKANSVQIQPPNEIQNVSLKTLRKSEIYGENTSTKIEIWYNFEKKGDYQLPPITILLQGRKRVLRFSKVKISENPENMLPRMIIEFSDGTTVSSDDNAPKKPVLSAKVGEKISFTIYLQYATQLVQFNWEIPKDSIFNQTKTYEFTEIKYREKRITDELIPIADFEWTALASGIIPMPRMKLTATAYNGYRNNLLMPAFSIEFTQAKKTSEELNPDAMIFMDAFTAEKTDSKSTFSQIKGETCEKLAQLRKDEHYTPHKYFSSKKQRIALEEELKLPSNQNEFNIAVFYFFLAATIIFILLFIFFLKKKKNTWTLITVVLITLSLTFLIYSSIKVSKKYAISKGATIYSIPETNASSISEIAPGNRIELLETVGDWYFVELGTISGWCNKYDVIKIQK